MLYEHIVIVLSWHVFPKRLILIVKYEWRCHSTKHFNKKSSWSIISLAMSLGNVIVFNEYPCLENSFKNMCESWMLIYLVSLRTLRCHCWKALKFCFDLISQLQGIHGAMGRKSPQRSASEVISRLSDQTTTIKICPPMENNFNGLADVTKPTTSSKLLKDTAWSVWISVKASW